MKVLYIAKFQLTLNVEISFFEIYNEKIHDLLGQTKDKSGKRNTVRGT